LPLFKDGRNPRLEILEGKGVLTFPWHHRSWWLGLFWSQGLPADKPLRTLPTFRLTFQTSQIASAMAPTTYHPAYHATERTTETKACRTLKIVNRQNEIVKAGSSLKNGRPRCLFTKKSTDASNSQRTNTNNKLRINDIKMVF